LRGPELFGVFDALLISLLVFVEGFDFKCHIGLYYQFVLKLGFFDKLENFNMRKLQLPEL
jgi:hypothetical protein